MPNTDDENPREGACAQCGVYPADPDQPVPAGWTFGPVCITCSMRLAYAWQRAQDFKGELFS